MVREHRGIHTHALAITRAGTLIGEDSDYHPGDQSYHESIWALSPGGGMRYLYGPSPDLPRGVGINRDRRSCTYHADQTARGGRPLIHRRCGQRVERLVGSAADDRAFRPVLVNDVAGSLLGADGSFIFRQGTAVRRWHPDGRVTVVADRLAAENFGIAIDAAGRLLVAEFARRRVLAISSTGQRRVLATSAAPWGPTGIAVRGGVTYILEATEYQRGVNGRMRVRRLGADGVPSVLGTVTIPPA